MNVILENLDSGLFRCTVRHHGATMAFVDHSEPKQAVLAALRQGAAGHMLQDGSFDMTYLELNDAAKQALAATQPEAAPAVDWQAVGPRLVAALRGAQQALRRALPHCPADVEHNGDSVFVGEWLDEVNEVLALVPAA